MPASDRTGISTRRRNPPVPNEDLAGGRYCLLHLGIPRVADVARSARLAACSVVRQVRWDFRAERPGSVPEWNSGRAPAGQGHPRAAPKNIRPVSARDSLLLERGRHALNPDHTMRCERLPVLSSFCGVRGVPARTAGAKRPVRARRRRGSTEVSPVSRPRCLLRPADGKEAADWRSPSASASCRTAPGGPTRRSCFGATFVARRGTIRFPAAHSVVRAVPLCLR